MLAPILLHPQTLEIARHILPAWNSLPFDIQVAIIAILRGMRNSPSDHQAFPKEVQLLLPGPPSPPNKVRVLGSLALDK
jgi:hypothetical protein